MEISFGERRGKPKDNLLMFAGWKWVTKKNTKRKSNEKMVK